MATLAAMKTELAALETALSSGVTSYTINGSHSVSYGSMDKLESRAQTLRRRIFRFQGYESRTTPDFNDSSSSDNGLIP
jgi:hypothetical protein